MIDSAALVEDHYGQATSFSRLMQSLDGLEPLTPLLLAPLDQFHVGGMPATVELAELAGVAARDAVLDVGSGLGGPSRTLAALGGATVTGIDLTPTYCEIAMELTRRCGLQDRIQYQVANALAMPFEAEQFDLVWSQHVAMNIADRAGLYREMRRVVKTGGRVALYDVVSIDGQAPDFPVPWAREATHSHLVTAEAMQALLVEAGLQPVEWRNATSAGLEWLRHRRPPSGQEAGRPGLHMVLGPAMRDMLQNLRRSFEAGRIGLIMAVARRHEQEERK